MTYSLTDVLLVPFINILQSGERTGIDAKKFIGKHYTYREAFRLGYNVLEPEHKLEKLPEEKKLALWNESLTYCPDDRLAYCKAIYFYYLVTNKT